MAAAPKLGKRVSGQKSLAFALTLFYPATVAASVWWSLRGPGDKENFKIHTFKKHYKHNKLDSNEYDALPSPIQQHRDEIIKGFINIYSCTPNMDAERVCDRNIEFEDPIIYTSGRASAACIIWGLPKITKNAEVTNVEVEQFDQAVKLKFDYLWETRLFSVSAPVQLYLTLNEEQNQVISVKDMWNGRPLFDVFPYKAFKSINGFATRVVFGISTGRLFR